jgi:hypothetical protein
MDTCSVPTDLLSRLSDVVHFVKSRTYCPYIFSPVTYGLAGGFAHLYMELYDFSLETYLKRPWTHNVLEAYPAATQDTEVELARKWIIMAFRIIVDVMGGIAFLHSHGRVHGDLTPCHGNLRTFIRLRVKFNILLAKRIGGLLSLNYSRRRRLGGCQGLPYGEYEQGSTVPPRSWKQDLGL